VRVNKNRINKNFNISAENQQQHHEITQFNDAQQAWEYSVPSQPDPTYGIADMADNHLESFFSRPIKIASYNWAVGSALSEIFNPWTLFFENPRVINRMSNYYLMRAKLKVKIVLNGNAFHYGRVLASYQPLHVADSMSLTRQGILSDAVERSQRPHLYLDPNTSKGGTMCLPFFWPSNGLVIPLAEWRQMGQIYLDTLFGLKHANGGTDNVTVSVFAWAEDVKLSVPTVNDALGISPQSEFKSISPDEEDMIPEGDEYGVGPISKIGNAISVLGGAANKVPALAPYAMATTLAGNTLSGVARIFGYSRPALLNDTMYNKPTLVGNLANANMPDTCQRLTLDCKQELTIDPRTVGLAGDDEMTITSVATRESYYSSFPWTVTQAPETLIWNSYVNPSLFSRLGTPPEIHMTALCFAAQPFRYWRGSIKYRFQIVASSFHRGRIKVVYEPYANTGNEYNTNYTRIVDIATEKDFTVEVGWGAHRSMLGKFDALASSPIIPSSLSALTTPRKSEANGIISVYVLNELTTPDNSINNSLSILVSVAGGDDIQFMNPAENALSTASIFEPQSAFVDMVPQAEAFEESEAQQDVAPIAQNTEESFQAMTTTSDPTTAILCGDPVVSFRTALKRYNLHSVDPVDPGIGFHKFVNQNFPYFRGFDPNGVDLASVDGDDVPYNFCKLTLLNYLSTAYQGWRGSIRYKHTMSGAPADTSFTWVASRINGNRNVARDFVPTLSLSDNVKRAIASAEEALSGWQGSTATCTGQNPVLEFELPYQEIVRFSPCKSYNHTTTAADNGGSYETSGYYDVRRDGALIQKYLSVGEDFQLFWYTGPPVFYRQVDPVPA